MTVDKGNLSLFASLGHLLLAGAITLPLMSGCLDSSTPRTENNATDKLAEEEADDGIYVRVDERPRLKGGISALHKAIEYPEEARIRGVEGVVVVDFVVTSNGKPEDLQIRATLPGMLAEPAAKAVRQQKFEPGRLNGRPVSTTMTLPVTFSLPEDCIDRRDG